MSPLLVLQARAEARALLFEACEYETLAEAIEPLLDYAHTSGLVDIVGTETIWQILRTAFEGRAAV